MDNFGRNPGGSTTLRMAKAVLRDLSGSVSASIVLDGLRTGRLDSDLAFKAVDFDSYDQDPTQFAKDYLAYNLIRKNIDLPGGLTLAQRTENAYAAFYESERACKLQNTHDGLVPSLHLEYSLDMTHEAAIYAAKSKIAKLLGPFCWNEASKFFAFSGGASTRLARKHGNPYYKISGKPEVTRNCALLGVCAIWSSPVWRRHMQDMYGRDSDPCTWVNVVPGNRITTVPKSSDVERVIAIEPDLNMYIQKGIGAVIRKRLRKVSIDLNDQERNQRLALIGSGTGSLATIDLRSASDSVSLSLCRMLLPADWYEALCTCRSEYGVLDGKSISYEKISSMGNGYTFELESLLFWALTSASCLVSGCEDDRIGIYGDDIICHASYAPYLVGLLKSCGFETNDKKTFIKGPFRESCGKHYYLGFDVSPYFIKRDDHVSGDVSDLIQIRNSHLAWCRRTGNSDKLLKYLTSAVPKKNRYYAPRSFGLRAGLHCDEMPSGLPFDEEKQGYRIRVHRYYTRKALKWDDPAYLAFLHNLPDNSGEPREAIPFSVDVGVKRLRVFKCVVSWWD